MERIPEHHQVALLEDAARQLVLDVLLDLRAGPVDYFPWNGHDATAHQRLQKGPGLGG